MAGRPEWHSTVRTFGWRWVSAITSASSKRKSEADESEEESPERDEIAKQGEENDMKASAVVCTFCMTVIVLSAAQAVGQVSMTTQHNDNWRTGQNTHETILTTGNVNKSRFGLLCKISVNGQCLQAVERRTM
jgi:hypothetical protein